MKRQHGSNSTSIESVRKKEKLSSLDDAELLDLISHLKHERSNRMLRKLNSLPDEMIGTILSFLDRFEVLSLGNLLFFKKWSKFIFHHDEYWSGLFGDLFPEVNFEMNLHGQYLLSRIRDYEQCSNIDPLMISIDTGGGSDISVTRTELFMNFTRNIYYIEWSEEPPIIVNAYQGYNAQECEKFSSFSAITGVYYSSDKFTKFYFVIESEYGSRSGNSEYEDTTLIDIRWTTPKGEIIDNLVTSNSADIVNITKLLTTTLLEVDQKPQEWLDEFIHTLQAEGWFSDYFKLYAESENEGGKSKRRDMESESEDDSSDSG